MTPNVRLVPNLILNLGAGGSPTPPLPPNPEFLETDDGDFIELDDGQFLEVQAQ